MVVDEIIVTGLRVLTLFAPDKTITIALSSECAKPLHKISRRSGSIVQVLFVASMLVSELLVISYSR